jgi:predicted CXXCH cytochrome family protein
MLKAGSPTNTNAVCQACHNADGAANTKRWPGWEAYAKTTNLHFNPPISGSGTLRTYPGKSYEPGECLNCHNPHGTDAGGAVTPAMTRDKEARLCMQCHTEFRARVPEGTTVRHKCSLCHNPHLVESGNRWLIAKGTDKTQETTDSKKDGYRGVTLLADSYCTGCHYAGNPYGAPLYQDSNFQDSRYAAGNKLANLHNVHLVGPMAGDGRIHPSCTTCHNDDCGDCHGMPYTAPHAYFNIPYTPGLNRLRCTDCHDVHPTAGPVRPVGMSSRMLRADRITSLQPINGKYNGKSGCGTGYPCHYNSATKAYTSWSCDWCHATTAAGAGSPGRAGCTCHIQEHPTIQMP